MSKSDYELAKEQVERSSKKLPYLRANGSSIEPIKDEVDVVLPQGSSVPMSRKEAAKYRIDMMIDSGYPHAVISSSELSAYNNNLVGRILTIVDATGIDDKAKKAVKDLIKQSVYEAFDHVKDWMQYGEENGRDFPYTHSYNIEP